MSQKLDLGKLLGFDTLRDLDANVIDFQDDTVSAKLGAKGGCEATIKQRASNVVDFQDDKISAKLGAKGGEPMGARLVRR
jgi:hypothetical protein